MRTLESLSPWRSGRMEKVHGKPKEKVDTGKTADGHAYFINEYPASKS